MPSLPRSPEDDASFQGMGTAISMVRERVGMSSAELAETIGIREVDMQQLERGELDADWATLRVVARELELPLGALIELAEESAPGEGGEQWRRWSREAEGERDVD
jgi:ribosome-binding protein aMBF1 (putative translation factor)